MKIGIIAEDKSDVEVMGEFTLALLKPHKVAFKHFVGDGCGKLRKKCAAWADILVRQGCGWVVVIHDLDDFNETELRAHLIRAVSSACPKKSVVLIPKRELESWLLYDGAAIAAAFGSREGPSLPADPEALADPKKHLQVLVWKTYRKRYLNTIHNLSIARGVRIALLARARSFLPYPPFAADIKRQVGQTKLRASGGHGRH